MTTLSFSENTALKKEEEELNTQEADMKHMPHMLHLEVRNEAIDGKKLIQVKDT